MTLLLALRSLLGRPVRNAVLAGAFGFGVGVMAALLGVGEVILQQARAPALAGGGDLLALGRSGSVANARYLAARVLGAPPLAGRVEAVSPQLRRTLYVVGGGHATQAAARGGIPGLEHAVGDPEVAAIAGWRDAPADAAWSRAELPDLLRAMDRFHEPPRGTPWDGSWAEWLYFNGRAGDARFYLSFIAGAPGADGDHPAGVRLQLERGGRTENFSAAGRVAAADLLAHAPDLDFPGGSVRLEGARYVVRLALPREGGGAGIAISGELVVDAAAGRSLPPLVLRGAHGWVSGYVVPVLSGPLDGALRVHGSEVSFAGGTGYHDHNWGLWRGVTWQWGQVAGPDLSIVWGRVRPPPAAADPARVPGVLLAVPDRGEALIAVNITIEESDDPLAGRPAKLAVSATSAQLDLRLDVDVRAEVRTSLSGSRWFPGGQDVQFLQLEADYAVSGRAAGRRVSFRARGSAETFHGR
ncbi:MAG: hypothetical protein KBD01_11255 [Acidobacteria bacterium]|nr:hypothetical protein [Acidobacteriota bacterium]